MAALATTAVCGQKQELSADLNAAVVGPALVDLPLVLKLTVTNTTNRTIYYWCGGPANYPMASAFFVTAMDRHGKKFSLQLENGQYTEGIGHDYLPIKGTQTFPAACDPLPPGTYSIQVTADACYALVGNKEKIQVRPAMTSKPIQITVAEDRAQLQLENRRLLDRENTEPFARYVAQAYSIDPVNYSFVA